MPPVQQPNPTAEKAPTCPFCRASEVTTTTGKFDTSGYWRCEKCGEMWNVDRHRETSRNRHTRFWR